MKILLMPDAALQTARCSSSGFLGFTCSFWRTLALKQRVLSWLRDRERPNGNVSQAVSREIRKRAKFMLVRNSVRIFLQFLIGTQAFQRKILIKIVKVFLPTLAKVEDAVQIESQIPSGLLAGLLGRWVAVQE